jgi:hypothetical protein
MKAGNGSFEKKEMQFLDFKDFKEYKRLSVLVKDLRYYSNLFQHVYWILDVIFVLQKG